MLRNFIYASIFLSLALGGCAQPAGEDTPAATVSGTATYLQRIALPEDAVMTVRIEDISLADAPAETIGEQVIETGGQQVPIAFEVPYDPSQIIENHTYGLRVRIESGSGELLFINDTVVPVITRGAPTEDIEVILVQV